MSRKIAREILMKLLYEKDVAGEHNRESFEILKDEHLLSEKEGEYVKNTILLFSDEEINTVDTYIARYAKDWTLDRMSKVDLAIMRLAMYELLYSHDIPISVSINEAVRLAKKYGNEKSGSFINGILGNFAEVELKGKRG